MNNNNMDEISIVIKFELFLKYASKLNLFNGQLRTVFNQECCVMYTVYLG